MKSFHFIENDLKTDSFIDLILWQGTTVFSLKISGQNQN